jgi:hypothetical protein
LSNALAGISPAQKQRDRVADSAFFWPSQLHFGRFGVFTEIALNHPNIVVIQAAGSQDGVFYVATNCWNGALSSPAMPRCRAR